MGLFSKIKSLATGAIKNNASSVIGRGVRKAFGSDQRIIAQSDGKLDLREHYKNKFVGSSAVLAGVLGGGAVAGTGAGGGLLAKLKGSGIGEKFKNSSMFNNLKNSTQNLGQNLGGNLRFGADKYTGLVPIILAVGVALLIAFGSGIFKVGKKRGR